MVVLNGWKGHWRHKHAIENLLRTKKKTFFLLPIISLFLSYIIIKIFMVKFVSEKNFIKKKSKKQ